MSGEFTAVFERDGDWIIAYCPEVPRANGRGGWRRKRRRALQQRSNSSWRTDGEDGLRAIPADAVVRRMMVK